MSFTHIRRSLLETMEKLRAGKIDRADALAVSQLSQTYFNSIKIEVEAAKVAAGLGIRLKDVIDGKEVLEIGGPKLEKGIKVITDHGICTVEMVDGDKMMVHVIDREGKKIELKFEDVRII